MCSEDLVRKSFYYFILSTLLLYIPLSAVNGQSIRINYINTDNYPIIEAGFTATHKDGSKIYNSSVQDFSVSENNSPNKILEVINPQLDYQPVSIVLMTDLSVSMQGRKLALVKEGLIDFIDQVPLESSEIAIAGFSDESYIYTDFTQNRNRLISALEKLNNINGTNFNNAFLNNMQGALAIGQDARNRKVIVFITDGLGTTDEKKVSSLAAQYGAVIFVLNIGLSIPKDLKSVTEQSGGLYFDRISGRRQFNSAASAIFRQMKCTDYGIVRWQANADCEKVKSVNLKYKMSSLDFDYDVPADKTGRIEIDPTLIQFGVTKAGTEQSQKLAITVKNIPVTVTSIRMDSSSSFHLPDSISCPFIIKEGETFQTRVRFLAQVAGLYDGNIRIRFAECPEMNVNLRAGGEEQIRLIFPEGGETFSVGEDTSVLWNGVMRAQPVDISYRFSEETPWKYIGRGKNLSYLWKLPLDTSSQAQIRLTPFRRADENMVITSVIDGINAKILSISYSSDGNRLITSDSYKFINTWDIETGKIITSLGGYDIQHAAFSSDDQRLFLFSGDETFIWNMENNRLAKLAGRILKYGKKVYTSFILPDGHEELLNSNVSTDPSKNTRIWSAYNLYRSFLLNQPDIKWASFTPDGKLTVTLDIKNNIRIFRTDSALLVQTFSFRDIVSQAIINPDGEKILVKLPQEYSMIDITASKELYRFTKSKYLQFTGNGKYFLIEDANRSKKLIESSGGTCVFDLSSCNTFEISPLCGFMVCSRKDTVSLFDLKSRKEILSLAGKHISLARFDPDESRVYLLTSINKLEIYNTKQGDYLGTIDGFSARVKDFIVNPVQRQLAMSMENNRIEIMSPANSHSMKEAVSGKFRIISPKPTVADTVQFDEQIVNSIFEKNIPQFISNPSLLPVNIRRIEITGKDSSDFEVVTKDFPLKVGSKSQLSQEFRFSPVRTGIRQAVIRTCTPTDTFFTVIVGQGTRPEVFPLVRHLDFGKIKVGTVKDTLASIMVNTGNDTLIIRSLKNNGPDEAQFRILADNNTIKVAPDDTLRVLLRFNPLFRGKTTTGISISPFNETNRIILLGEGIAPREIILTGTARSSSDSIPVDATVKNIDLESDRKLSEVQTGKDGRFRFRLFADRNYGVTAEKDGFISASLNIDLSEKVNADSVNKDIYLTPITPGAVIRFNCIFFEFDKATFLPGSQTDMKRMLEIINKYKFNSFEIHGHTDSEGSEKYNLMLSRARATAVLNYLLQNGASKEKLSIRFFGESQPVATNATEEGRALNRRVELKIVD